MNTTEHLTETASMASALLQSRAQEGWSTNERVLILNAWNSLRRIEPSNDAAVIQNARDLFEAKVEQAVAELHAANQAVTLDEVVDRAGKALDAAAVTAAELPSVVLPEEPQV